MAKTFEGYDWDTKSLDELLDSLTDKVKEDIEDELRGHLRMYLSLISDCESPIEQLMALALRGFEGICRSWSGEFMISKQYKIQCGEEEYRVDFFVECTYEGKKHQIVIECDGHDFHEKTKQQASKDKQRDRNLTKNGYQVLRFTGSEIFKNHTSCAWEALGLIFPQFRR